MRLRDQRMAEWQAIETEIGEAFGEFQKTFELRYRTRKSKRQSLKVEDDFPLPPKKICNCRSKSHCPPGPQGSPG